MAIRYVSYPPNILHGQALLGFPRTHRMLMYNGDSDVEARLLRGLPLYETAVKEIRGDASANLLVRGECLSACAYMRENGIMADLVYIDPPFASGADYAKKIHFRRNPHAADLMARDKVELSNADMQTFEAKMYGDIWNKERYLNWMYENLVAIKSVMSPNASIYVHLDWHIGHYVKILLDEIFGESNFRNEIIWAYRIQGISKGSWPKKHDTIFYYSLNPDDSIFTPEKETIVYEKPFMDTVCTKPDVAALSDKERHYISESLNHGKALKDSYKSKLFNRYTSEVYVRDVWDCDSTRPLISGSSEYVGYRTQKPEGLLERIIRASSKEGMVVADFFGGSGVTAAVAARMGRRFIHVDVNENSIQTARDRLVRNDVSFTRMEIKDGVTLFRNPVQTDEVIPRLIEGLTADSTLNGIWAGCIHDAKYGKVPVYIPRLVQGAESRVLTLSTIHKLIFEELSQFPPDTIRRVIVYYIDIDDEQSIRDYIRKHNTSLVEFVLKDLKPILDQMVAQDEAQFQLYESDNGILNRWTVEITGFFSDRIVRKIDEYNLKGENCVKTKPVRISLSDNGLEAIEWLSLDCTNAGVQDAWHSDSEIKIDEDNFVILNGVKTKELWDGKIHSDRIPLRLRIRNICGDESTYLINREEIRDK